MSTVTRISVLGVSDKVEHRTGYKVTEESKELYISNLTKKKKDCTIHAAKTKALTSCAVNAQLICSFVFA